MKYNKGFAPLILVAIIVGALVIGGGAYWWGSKGNKAEKEVKVEENNQANNFPSDQNQNNNQVDNNKNTAVESSSSVTTTVTPQVVTGCTPTSTPSIKVISPNGGEVFTLGQTINIKWSSKCIDSKALVYLNIGIKDSQAVSELLDGIKVANTGSYNFIIPNNYNVGGNKSNKYEVGLSYIYGNGEQASDRSDNSFTINVPKGTYTYKSHGFTMELPSGYIPHEEQSEGGPAMMIILPVGGLAYVTDASFWEKYNIPNYTYVKDEKIGDTTFKVYTYMDSNIYWFKQGNVGYEFSMVKFATTTDTTKLENLMKTFKFVGWN